jgi:hypothetical protein
LIAGPGIAASAEVPIAAVEHMVRSGELSIRRAPIGSSKGDGRARAEYALRIAELETELAEATRNHDLGRIDAVRRERETVMTALEEAYGLVPVDDRLRKQVWRNLRATAIPAIRKVMPLLAKHLDDAIDTGTFCRYRPARSERWRIEYV